VLTTPFIEFRSSFERRAEQPSNRPRIQAHGLLEVIFLWRNRKKRQSERRKTTTIVLLNGVIRTPHSDSSRFSRRWLWRAAKFNPQISSADSTGILRSMLPSIPSTPKDQEDFKFGLAVEALRCCGMVRLKASGVSMLPSLWPGDLLAIQSVTVNDAVAGDIVLVLRDKQCFIHRLVRKQASENCVCFITRGDAMPDNDPPVATAELLGRVIEVRRGNRSFVPNRRVSFVRCAVAWMLCRSDRFRVLALRMHAARLQGWRRTGRSGSGSFVGVCAVPGVSASRQP